MDNNIPEIVANAASEFINIYGNTIEYIGEYNGYKAYRFNFPAHSETGFPFIYLHDTHSDDVKEITGLDAIDVINALYK